MLCLDLDYESCQLLGLMKINIRCVPRVSMGREPTHANNRYPDGLIGFQLVRCGGFCLLAQLLLSSFAYIRFSFLKPQKVGIYLLDYLALYSLRP